MVDKTKKHVHIPKPNLLPVLGIILFGALSYLNLKLLDWELIKVVFARQEVIEQFTFNLSYLINIYPLIGEYVLISLTVISLVALIKGGYKNLKKYDEDGLISSLTFSLILALTVGLTFSLILGLIGALLFGLTIGLTFSLILGLIGALLGGLILGLTVGLIGDLMEEFKK